MSTLLQRQRAKQLQARQAECGCMDVTLPSIEPSLIAFEERKLASPKVQPRLYPPHPYPSDCLGAEEPKAQRVEKKPEPKKKPKKKK